MLFHTHEFLLLLAFTGLAFSLLPGARQLVLLVASIAFYAYSGVAMLALFATVVLFNYFCFRRIGPDRGRGFLTAAIVLDLATLGFFKYSLFLLGLAGDLGLRADAAESYLAASLVLPVGLSFYVFEMIAILVDARRGSAPHVSGLRDFALFATFFPHLIAGPILRGHELIPQFRRLPGPSVHQIAQAVVWLLSGLVKKVFFADVLLAPRVDELFARSTSWDSPTSWLLGVLFGFQIYFDFAGYCDMAVGLGKLFGIELRINFATPYVSRTPSEFWSRWNITLSRWFGDYVYVPLGGSRVPIARTTLNLLITMLLSGLWHGAGLTFLVWGGLHGAALASFHLLRRAFPVIGQALAHGGSAAVVGWLSTYLITTIGWVYFRAHSVEEANGVVANMFGLGSGDERGPLAALGSLAAILMALHFAERAWWDRMETSVERGLAVWSRLPGPAQALVVFPVLVAILGITKKVQGAFIYFQF